MEHFSNIEFSRLHYYILKFLVKIIRRVVVAFFASTILAVVVYKFFPVYLTPLMIIRCFEQNQQGKDIKLEHNWISLNDMSESMPVAVMASEDQRFLKHHGFDLDAIERAARHNQNGKECVSLARAILAP